MEQTPQPALIPGPRRAEAREAVRNVGLLYPRHPAVFAFQYRQ